MHILTNKGLRKAAQAEIRKILDTYDDPDFIRDFLEEDQ